MFWRFLRKFSWETRRININGNIQAIKRPADDVILISDTTRELYEKSISGSKIEQAKN